MEPLLGEDPAAVGPFRLLGRLGVGGMGRVYLARSAGGRTVAVKVVHGELAAQDEFRRRFAREVEALRRVGGTGTTPVLGADTDAEPPWVAIGYVPGPSLRAVVADEHGPLPPESVRSLAAGLARALGHVHSAGLVHRDLKPSNILLTVDGPRLIDFGIARAVDTVTDGGLTSTGAVVGSPGFMSPEQVRGEKLTSASDIFCLGSVLAYAATGRSPFGTADSGVHATMFRIAHDEPDLEGLPDELQGLVRACLAKSPGDRPSAEEIASAHPVADPWLPAGVLAALGRHAARILDTDGAGDGSGDGTGVGTAVGAVSGEAADTPVTPVPGAPRPPRGGGRRRTAFVAGAVALVLAAAGALTATYWPKDGRQSPEGKGGGSSSSSAKPAGVVPAAFIGAWEGVLKGTADIPHETVRIEITQGRTGAKTAVYTHITGERLCMGRATLVSADENRIVFGESDVTTSVPATRCTPAAHQTLTFRSPDVLDWTSGAVTTAFRRAKTGPDIVPASLVGHWKAPAFAEMSKKDAERYDYRVTVTQGPVGAPLVRFEQTFPKRDEETGAPVAGTVHCASTAVVGAAGSLLVVGPTTRDPDAWDPECAESPASNLRVDRYQGKERLLVYGMGSDGEPGEFFRL
ncbi:serine/threonine-protein kinase [Streptomyces purpureus]|uniref:serine/threonine-protein kinase n=1 Tax=Streptomyces purpureus TaxID=1951 RepID=UPI001E6382EC|nr:serine/threonine-protein kinase [Streptomyces purpureus]